MSIMRPSVYPLELFLLLLYAIHHSMSSSILSIIISDASGTVTRWVEEGIKRYGCIQMHREGPVLVPTFHVKKDESQNLLRVLNSFLPSWVHLSSTWVPWRSVATDAHAYWWCWRKSEVLFDASWSASSMFLNFINQRKMRWRGEWPLRQWLNDECVISRGYER